MRTETKKSEIVEHLNFGNQNFRMYVFCTLKPNLKAVIKAIETYERETLGGTY